MHKRTSARVENYFANLKKTYNNLRHTKEVAPSVATVSSPCRPNKYRGGSRIIDDLCLHECTVWRTWCSSRWKLLSHHQSTNVLISYLIIALRMNVFTLCRLNYQRTIDQFHHENDYRFQGAIWTCQISLELFKIRLGFVSGQLVLKWLMTSLVLIENQHFI